MSVTDTGTIDIEQLRGATTCRVVGPADDGWQEACQSFNLALHNRPAAVTYPTNEQDVADVVRFAAQNGLRVAPQCTTHNAGPLHSLEDVVLLKTTHMRGIDIDAQAGRARVLAGARWEDVVGPASDLGLAALHGSSPDVGIVGYTLGGGLGWYARKHGLAANHVTAIELVTAEGRLVRTDHDNEPELFWALRGGGGNFGVVTAIEFDLFPISEVYAGWLFFPVERAAEVLHTWNELLPDLPEEMTSVGRLLQIPPFPEIPEPLRGRSFVVVEAAFLGSQADGEALLAPLRELGPEMDTFAMVPPADVAELHMEPRDPAPAASGHRLLSELPPEAIDALVEVAGAESGSPLVSVELRHTGGALARSGPGHGARATLDGSLAMFAIGIAMDEGMKEAVESHLALVSAALEPWDAGRYLSFVERPFDTERAFTAKSYGRLRAVKAELDPHDLFRANHPISPAL